MKCLILSFIRGWKLYRTEILFLNSKRNCVVLPDTVRIWKIQILRQSDNKGNIRLIISSFIKDWQGKNATPPPKKKIIITSKPYVNNSYHKHIIVKQWLIYHLGYSVLWSKVEFIISFFYKVLYLETNTNSRNEDIYTISPYHASADKKRIFIFHIQED